MKRVAVLQGLGLPFNSTTNLLGKCIKSTISLSIMWALAQRWWFCFKISLGFRAEGIKVVQIPTQTWDTMSSCLNSLILLMLGLSMMCLKLLKLAKNLSIKFQNSSPNTRKSTRICKAKALRSILWWVSAMGCGLHFISQLS